MTLFINDRNVNDEHNNSREESCNAPFEEVGARDGASKVKHTKIF